MSTDESSIPSALFHEMLLAVRLSPAEAEARFALARDRAYWSKLCPELTIDGASPPETNAPALSPPDLGARLVRDGWMRSEPFFSAGAMQRILGGIDAVTREGWPAVFAFVYDELWQVMRHPAIVELFSGLMGADLVQLPFVWCHQVAARRGATGWLPHVDDATRAGAVTVWMPVTDATLDNGCIVVVPRGAVEQEIQDRFLASAQLTKVETQQLLQAAHALPAAAGSVLAWLDSTIHWGGRCVEPTSARISLAFTFAARPADPSRVPECWAGFFDARGPAPSFEDRVRGIGVALRRYWSEEPLTSRWDPLAKMLSA